MFCQQQCIVFKQVIWVVRTNVIMLSSMIRSLIIPIYTPPLISPTKKNEWSFLFWDTGCVGDGCESEETNNKFALLFRQMLAKQRGKEGNLSESNDVILFVEDANTDCAIMEDCAEGFECFGGKCRSVGQRRTKIINLYSRWWFGFFFWIFDWNLLLIFYSKFDSSFFSK